MRQSIIRLAQKLINQMNKNLSEQSAPKIGLMVGVLVVITMAAYLPAVRAGFIWDDNDYVYDNWTLRSVEGLRQIWFTIRATPQYYPMVYTSYWLEYQFWELNPAGYHIVNILLHAVGAVLFWRILTILHLPKPGAWLAAVIFALHPVHVESVAWITERKNVLSGVFYLGAALAYLHYALAPENKSGRDTSRMFYIVSLVLFVCALLSKTVTCLLPAVLLLVLWWKRERIGWTDIRGLILFFVLGITFGLLTAGVEKQHVGAIGEEWNLSFIERCLVAGRALCFYAGKLFWPTRLTFIYPRWNIDTGVWWQYLYPAAAVSVVVLFWLARRRIGRGPVVAVLIFAGTLTPALGFLNFYMMRYTFAADHFQYLASLSLIALVTCCCAAVPSKRWKICVATVVIVFVLGSLGVLTWRQCHIYKNSETLWRDTLRKNPDSWMAHACLGNALRAQGKYDEAISCYFQALQLKPDNADSYYNLGTVSESQGKLDEAIDYYRQALQVQPDYTPAYYNLGAALVSKGHLDESIDQYRLALKFKPDYVEAHNSIGYVLLEQGKIDEAISHFRQALRLRPDFAPAHRNLGNALSTQGRLDEAVQHYRRSLQTEPNNAAAHYNLGIVLCLQGKLDEAIGHYQQALKLDTDSVGAYNNLALILATHPDPNIRNIDKAVSLAERAAELTNRQDVVILDTLATVYSRAGRYEQALTTAQAALELASAAADNEMAEHLREQVELYRQQKLMQKDQMDLAMPNGTENH